MKLFMAACAALLLSGCGSIITVVRDDRVTSEYLVEARSYCGAVPRVYSGTIFDFCVLHGAPEDENNYTSTPPIFHLLDLTLSAVVDTALLPYTLIRQNQDGSIEVNR
ncbi:hypothetical protein PMM47T1_16043 [Pseudomonas sp. M47T1]|uniref:YceK/YidQ family lipoprotein n=1 Tax=Pseudomonas sp. M47T1 TaxID=1179778 RepID=UPI0002607DCB|nr:YceK/YidQ family lipoprotein [Pseudomonas sp. M47T1]EIK95613.1 hypothetical protein PMM47T1_16043 [Pseudomonas sp. M47T1]